MGNPTTARPPIERSQKEQLATAYGASSRSLVLGTPSASTASGPALPTIEPRHQVAKRVLDIGGATVGLIVAAPLLLLITAALLISGQPPIFVHHRLGRSGKTFPCLKFQTMHRDAEERLLRVLASSERAKREWTAQQKLTNDPRITSMGRFLRRTNLDELPQLVNVLLGHMSLVGPRPIVAAERVRYGPAFTAVSSVRPGLTGLWQVSGRNSLSYERRIELDIDYVTSCSVFLDLWLITRTICQTLLALTGSRRSGGI